MAYRCQHSRKSNFATEPAQALTSPGFIQPQLPAVRGPSRAHVVPHRRPATDRAERMPRARRLVAGPRALLAPRVADRAGRGVDAGPVRHAPERTRASAL